MNTERSGQQSTTEKLKRTVRELADVPEKVAITVGAIAVALGLAFKKYALINPGLFLIAAGGISMGITRAFWPKKSKVAS